MPSLTDRIDRLLCAAVHGGYSHSFETPGKSPGRANLFGRGSHEGEKYAAANCCRDARARRAGDRSGAAGEYDLLETFLGGGKMSAVCAFLLMVLRPQRLHSG